MAVMLLVLASMTGDGQIDGWFCVFCVVDGL